MNLSPLPLQKFFDNNGEPLVRGRLFTYIAGTSTKLATYQNQAGTLNANPVVLDFRGEANVWLDPTLTYKFVLAPPGVDDPPTQSIWTVDNISAALTYVSLTQAILGAILYPISPAEVAASVSIVQGWYAYGNVLRYGTNTTPGTTNMTTAIQAAHNQANFGGSRPFLPAGSYLITTAISPCQLGMYGDGQDGSRLICNACNAFTIPSNAGWDRPAPVFEKFSIDSNNGTSCDANWAFYFPGVAAAAAVVYNSGFYARDLCIGRQARMGGAFYLKDLFGAKIEGISVTDAQRVVQIVGSVAQCSISNIDAFSVSAGTALAGGSVGFSTESAVYASGTLTPEHLTTHDLSLIVFDTGLQHSSGLDCNFHDTDVQARVTGLSIGAACDVRGAIVIPHSSGVGSWTGVSVGVSPGPKEGRFMSGIDVSVFNSPGTPATSYGFDLGDGVSPVFGVTLKECTVKGNAGSLQSLIRGRINKDLTIENCILEAAAALGTEVSLSSAQRLNLNFNQCAAGIFAVGDGGDATANGAIFGNQITTLTLSPLTSPQNWTIGQNDGLTPVQAAYETGSFTATLTGCTTAPTGTIVWVKQGRMVTMYIPPIVAVSNTAACSLTGLPANLQPGTQQDVIGRATDNSLNGICGYRFSSGSGTIGMFFGPALGAWTAANNKGSNSSTVPYML